MRCPGQSIYGPDEIVCLICTSYDVVTSLQSENLALKIRLGVRLNGCQRYSCKYQRRRGKILKKDKVAGMGEANGNEHRSIGIWDVDKQLAYSIRGKLTYKSPASTRSCIFRVPKVLRRHNPKAYAPKIISIGPFHRGKERLKGMEEIKLWYLQATLSRLPYRSLEVYIKTIRKIEERARACYAERNDLTGDEFVEMMVVDGCFIIELFRKKGDVVPININDPIFYSSWMLGCLQHDMMLLENQLPWFVLENLFNLTKFPGCENSSLAKIALNFFEDMLPTTKTIGRKSKLKNIHLIDVLTATKNINCKSTFESMHLLDMLRNTLLPSRRAMEPEDPNIEWEPTPCVTDLLQTGIEFKASKADDMLDIKFHKGVLEIPPLRIEENTESFFRNLIAFEQCHHSQTNKITSYAMLLDCLISTSKDVDILCRKGIIVSLLDAEEVSVLFNRLRTDAVFSEFYYLGICQKVNAYYRSKLHIWRAILKNEYFKNPWAIISIIAAVILLGLTMVQTKFAIRPA